MKKITTYQSTDGSQHADPRGAITRDLMHWVRQAADARDVEAELDIETAALMVEYWEEVVNLLSQTRETPRVHVYPIHQRAIEDQRHVEGNER